MNPLQRYLDSNNETPTSFAKKCGVSQPTIWRFLNSEINSLKADTALKIQEATGGAVTVMELLYPEQSKTETCV